MEELRSHRPRVIHSFRVVCVIETFYLQYLSFSCIKLSLGKTSIHTANGQKDILIFFLYLNLFHIIHTNIGQIIRNFFLYSFYFMTVAALIRRLVVELRIPERNILSYLYIFLIIIMYLFKKISVTNYKMCITKSTVLTEYITAGT